VRESHRKRIAMGLCRECGVKAVVSGRQRCIDCFKRLNAGYQRRRQKAIMAGVCIRVGCGRPIERNAFCKECRDKVRKTVRHCRVKRLARGLCGDCGVDVEGRRIICDACHCKRLAKSVLGNREKWVELMAIYQQQEGKCAYSGVRLVMGVDASIDHILPKGRGGTNEISNLQWVHWFVNVFRRHRDEREFIGMFEAFMQAATNTAWKCPKQV